MAIQVWLPLNSDMMSENKGIMNSKISVNGGETLSLGKTGKCFSFSAEDNIEISKIDSNSLLDCSISFWINVSSSTSWMPFTDGNGNYMMATNGVDAFQHRGIGTGNINIYGDGNLISSPLSPDTWHHYCIVGVNLSDWENILFNNYDSFWNFSGKLNDVRIYDYRLSTFEIRDLSKALVLHYTFDQTPTEEGIIYDCSGYENNGYSKGGDDIVLDSPSRKYRNYSKLSSESEIEIETNLHFIEQGTIAFWAKYEEGDESGKSILVDSTDGIVEKYVAICNQEDNRWQLGDVDSEGVKVYCDGVLSSNVFIDGKWHYYVFSGISLRTWNGRQSIAKISSENSSERYNFNGGCSDFRIYNSVLSQSDIQNLYRGEIKVSKYSTILCYEINEVV